MLRLVFFGDLPAERRGFPDLDRIEIACLAALLALVVLIGLWPGWLIDLIGADSILRMAGPDVSG